MDRTTRQAPRDWLAGPGMILAAFLAGAVLGGGLAMLFAVALPPPGKAAVPNPYVGAEAARVVPSTVEPVSATWQTVPSSLAERGTEGALALPPVGAGPLFPSGDWSLLLLTGAVLGACLVGAVALVWSTRQEKARLEARIRRFEELVAHRQGNWLDDLDTALEGQWEERR